MFVRFDGMECCFNGLPLVIPTPRHCTAVTSPVVGNGQVPPWLTVVVLLVVDHEWHRAEIGAEKVSYWQFLVQSYDLMYGTMISIIIIIIVTYGLFEYFCSHWINFAQNYVTELVRLAPSVTRTSDTTWVIDCRQHQRRRCHFRPIGYYFGRRPQQERNNRITHHCDSGAVLTIQRANRWPVAGPTS